MKLSIRQAACAAAWAVLASCGGGAGDASGVNGTSPPPSAEMPLSGQRAVGANCVGQDDTGWCWRAPQPAPRQLVDFDFIDSQRGWAVGEAGAVYATVDGGRSWTPRPIPFPQELRLVKFADANRGWVLTSLSRELFATEDGGQTWRNLGEPTAGVPYYGWGLNLIQGLELLGGSTLVARAVSRGSDLISENGGRTWRPSAVDYIAGASPRGTLWSRFPRGLVLSHDLGRTATTAIECSYTCVVDADFSDPDRPAALVLEWANGRPTDHFILYRSFDAGHSWASRDVVHPVFAQGDTLSIPRIFGLTLWASSTRGDVYTVPAISPPGGVTSTIPQLTGLWTSSDAGLTWTARTLPSARSALWALQPLDAATAWLRDGDGAYLTTDGATTWKKIAVPGEDKAVLDEVRRLRGVLIASFHDSTMRRWYSSDDGGVTWNPLPAAQAGSGPYFRALHFTDSMHGVAVTEDGLRETGDGGRTWERHSETEGLVPAGAMPFGPQGSVWMASSTQLLFTRDAGRSWQATDTGGAVPSTISALYFASDTAGWFVACSLPLAQGCGSQLYETRDAGAHWSAAPPSSSASGPGAILLASPRVYFRTPQEAWTPPLRLIDKPMRTTDGGRTWTPVPIPNTGAQVTAIHFADAQNGWMVGEHGLMLRTRDGGSTWEVQESGTERPLTSVFALDANTVYAGGWNGTLLFTRTGGRY